MSEHQADATSIPARAKCHISNLIKQGQVAYKIFEIVDTLDSNAFDMQNIRTSLFEIIEINARQHLNRNHEIHSTAQSILKLKHPYTEAVFRTWTECLYAAEPDRKIMRLLCSNFASLVPRLSPEVGERFLQLLPEFVKQHERDVFAIVPIVSTNLRKLNSTEQSVKYLDFLEKYLSSVSEKGLKGLLSLSLVLFRLPETSLLEEFENECSPKVLKRAAYAEKFVVQCGTAVHKVSKETQNKYLALCMVAAPQSFGSAMSIASDLPKKLEQLQGTIRDQYMDSFIRIVSKVGICAVGFCLGRLHRLFSSHALGEATERVELICEIASRYGSVAAFDFIKRKGVPAKRAWMRRPGPPVSTKMWLLTIFVFVLSVLLLTIVKRY